MALAKFKKGNSVVVITGKDRGTVGKVLTVDGEKLIVSGVNVRLKNIKPNPQAQQEGKQIKKETPIHVSNVAHYDAESKKRVKVALQVIEGKKLWVNKENGQPILGE